jgi:hypothetical protein
MDVIDLTDVRWERNLTSYTSGGAYLKASLEVDGVRRYLKLSNYDDERGFVGFESVYEHLASQLGLYLGLIEQVDTLRLPPVDRQVLWDRLFSVFDADEDFPSWHRDKAMELITKRMDRAQTILDNR